MAAHISMWGMALRVVFLYVLVMVSLRIMGKREIGQLSVFDFVVSVMIAELSTLAMEDGLNALLKGIISIATLVVLQVVVANISIRSHRFRHWVDGEPSVLIEHGEIKDKEMRKTRYAVGDLLMQLREKGFTNVADVEFAILETSGQLSVIPKAEKRPITPEDLGQRVQPEFVPMPIIIDGTPVQKTLDALKKDALWLEAEIRRRGYGSVKQVIYADVDEHGTLNIDSRDD